MDKLVDFRSVDQRIKYKCSWSPTHRRPWCFKAFFGNLSFFWWSFMSTCTHVMLHYCYVLLHLHTHVMLRYGDLLLHLLTHVMLRYGYLGVGLGGVGGAMTFMSTCTHTSCYVIVMFSCTCTHTSCYVMVIFSCTCSHTSCYAMVILGPLTPHRFLEELCKAVKAMKRFWEEGKKVLHPKKARTYVKKRSSFGDFQNPIFHVNMRKNDVSL